MKRMKNNSKQALGLPSALLVTLPPGEDVEITDSQYEKALKSRTFARWLASGVISVDGKKADVEAPKKPDKPADKNADRDPPELPEGLTGEGVETHHKGAGWYRVYVNGLEVTDKNVRKAEAAEIAGEYE